MQKLLKENVEALGSNSTSMIRTEEISSVLKRKIIDLLEKEKRKNFYKEEDINKLLQCYERCFPKKSKSIKFKGAPTMTTGDTEKWNKEADFLLKRPKFQKGKEVLAKIKDVDFPAKIHLIDDYSKPYRYIVEIDKLVDKRHIKLLTGDYNQTKIVNERDIKMTNNKEYRDQFGIVQKIATFRKGLKNVEIRTPVGIVRMTLKIGKIICLPGRRYDTVSDHSEIYPKCGQITGIDPIEDVITVSFITSDGFTRKDETYGVVELKEAIRLAKQSNYYDRALAMEAEKFGVLKRGGKHKHKTKKNLYNLKKHRKKSNKLKKKRKKSVKKKRKKRFLK